MPAPKDPEKYKLWIERQRASHTGKKDSEETLEKKRISHLGIEPWNKGIPTPIETCNKMSEHMKGIPKPPRSKEHCKKISDRNSGEGNPMFNKKHTPEAREKMHNAQLGNTKSLGRKPTKQMSIKLSNAFKGNKCHFWKGGVTPLRLMIRVLLEYKLWKRQIFERDNFTCKECNKRGGYLEAHHKKSFSQIVEENNVTNLEQAQQCEELWNVDNGVTLCKKCHRKKHRKNN